MFTLNLLIFENDWICPQHSNSCLGFFFGCECIFCCLKWPIYYQHHPYQSQVDQNRISAFYWMASQNHVDVKVSPVWPVDRKCAGWHPKSYRQCRAEEPLLPHAAGATAELLPHLIHVALLCRPTQSVCITWGFPKSQLTVVFHACRCPTCALKQFLESGSRKRMNRW